MSVGLEYVKSVVKKYESDLLKIEGVEGIAIGREDGEWVIMVFVEKDKYEKVKHLIPTVLDGVRVVVKLVEKPFELLPV